MDPLSSNPGLPRSSDSDFHVFARNRFFQLILQVRRRARTVVNGQDPEAVHAFRVALRRLRAAIRSVRSVYRSPYLARIDAGLKELASSTSELRDLEVTEATILSLPDLDVQGLDTYIEEIHLREAECRAAVKRGLSRPDALLPLRQLRAFFLLPPGPLDDSPPLLALKTVDRFLRPVQRDLKRIHRRRTKTPWLHALRIKCKRLRYSVDFFHALLPGTYREVSRAARQLQNRLGELHDHDFILERLKKDRGLAPSERARLRQALKTRRAEILEETLAKADEHRAVLARFV